VPVTAQQCDQQLAIDRVVIDDEDRCHGVTQPIKTVERNSMRNRARPLN
jgi:hypothetical protein